MNKSQQRLSQLTHALLKRRLQRIRRAQDKQHAILRRPNAASFPLSFAQERFWFLMQMEPDTPVYNRPLALRLSGKLDVSALQAALNEIICRHPVLRAKISTIDGQPVQTIVPSVSLPLSVMDLPEITNTHSQNPCEAQVRQIAIQLTQQPFDLSQGSLLRATLLRLTEESHILILVTHHIVFDAWSAQILYRELVQRYEAYTNGHPAPLSKLPIQYADFAHWQRQTLQGEVLERQLAYWSTQLADVPTSLNLPTDQPRPAVQTFHGAQQTLILSTTLSQRLQALSQRENVTLFMTLLAAFKVLLYRYTGQEDVVVGSPIAGRNRVETEELIGLFLNTLVMRTDLSGEPSFRELLTRVRTTALEAYAHQDLPFEKLVAELKVDRHLDQGPLFQVLFNLENVPAQAKQLQHLHITEFKFDHKVAAFDLTIEISKQDGGLSCIFNYNTDLFEAATIERMMGHFRTLLTGIITNPDTTILQLPLLTEFERQQLLIRWNNTQVDYPQDTCLHQLFEHQVERTPDATAVVFEGQTLTYRQLNAKANQLAHYLQQYDVGPEVLVGLCVERSLETVVGLLGILKAGGAYLPLDPTYPKERLAFMLADSQMPVLLTQQRLQGIMPNHQAHPICLDTDWAIIGQKSEESPPDKVRADNLLYVIYTSGSTGQPKGVALPHHPLTNLIAWQRKQSTLGQGAKTLQFTSLGFDVSCQEIFATWCSGGTLVMLSETVRHDVERLAAFIIDHRIERLFLPFIALQHLAEAMIRYQTQVIHLKEVITAGEQLQTTPAIINLFSRLPDCRLYNHYGPSESHVVTAFALPNSPSDWSALPPIGRPIANTHVFLLDAQQQPVPIGVPGELYIGGHCLARGYLNRPQLTQEKFVPHPFSEAPTARLYKTGDLARYLSNGDIVFLGRLDHQVKIRGFRIELGEVESALGQHPAIQENVVVVNEDTATGKSLIAYLVIDQTMTVSASELRRFLQKQLPEYMLPTAFIPLDTLPLTPSGKVDRRALPDPDQTRLALESIFVAPQTPSEEKIATIWTEVLKIERVGINDNFFDLGGHSLLATRVISRVRDAFDIDLPLLALFETPTINGLVNRINALMAAQSLQITPDNLDDIDEIGEL